MNFRGEKMKNMRLEDKTWSTPTTYIAKMWREKHLNSVHDNVHDWQCLSQTKESCRMQFKFFTTHIERDSGRGISDNSKPLEYTD